MLKVFGALFLLMGGWLAYQGFFTWNHCGYDCKVGLSWLSLSATTAMVLGIISLLIGISVLATLLPGVRVPRQ